MVNLKSLNNELWGRLVKTNRIHPSRADYTA